MCSAIITPRFGAPSSRPADEAGVECPPWDRPVRARAIDWPRKLTPELKQQGQETKLMAEGEETNNDAANAGTAGGDSIEEGGAEQPTSGAEASGADPAGFEPSGVGDPASEGESGSEGESPGAWNPGE